MRDDFAFFILTHGRADNVVTYKTLQRLKYDGKIFLIIDDEDNQRDKYISNFGEDRVVVFDKQKAYDSSDTQDNFNQHKAIIYARNVSFEIARKLGLTYFMMLDDDYDNFRFRFFKDGILSHKVVEDLQWLIDTLIDFYEASDAKTVALCQGGDFIGGINGANFKKGLLRKAMNSFLCRADNPIAFKGTMNEDVTTYTTLGSRGDRFFSVTHASINQLQTQSLAGGMTDVYKDEGTYVKSFYSVMSMPSAVRVSVMDVSHRRVHHHVNWECCVPKIISGRYKKA